MDGIHVGTSTHLPGRPGQGTATWMASYISKHPLPPCTSTADCACMDWEGRTPSSAHPAYTDTTVPVRAVGRAWVRGACVSRDHRRHPCTYRRRWDDERQLWMLVAHTKGREGERGRESQPAPAKSQQQGWLVRVSRQAGAGRRPRDFGRRKKLAGDDTRGWWQVGRDGTAYSASPCSLLCRQSGYSDVPAP